MKVKDLKKLLSKATDHIELKIHDLDDEFKSFTSDTFLVRNDDFIYTCALSNTQQEAAKVILTKLWNKDIIKFDIEAVFNSLDFIPCSPICESDIRILNQHRAPDSYIFHLYVSNYTNEQRAEIAHNKKIQEAKKELERLSGRKVKFGDEIKKPKVKNKKLVCGSNLNIEDTIKIDKETGCLKVKSAGEKDD